MYAYIVLDLENEKPRLEPTGRNTSEEQSTSVNTSSWWKMIGTWMYIFPYPIVVFFFSRSKMMAKKFFSRDKTLALKGCLRGDLRQVRLCCSGYIRPVCKKQDEKENSQVITVLFSRAYFLLSSRSASYFHFGRIFLGFIWGVSLDTGSLTP